ncbi:MAG: high-affinity nickel-transport family protein [Actinomycetota bacterium]|nr:high-affinity nickel-transport family protein [Actinomycetota bacterium]
MSLFLTFITSLMLGMRHATDPDHIVAVTTIVSRERSVAKAAGIGAVWGVGHTITLLLVGGAIVAFKIVFDARLGLSMELCVAIMLIVLGALNLFDVRTKSGIPTRSRPFLVGGVHGLAGSAAAALLIVPLIDDPSWAALYLLMFGLGTIVGMTVVTLSIAAPSLLDAAHMPSLQRSLRVASGAVSLVFGLYLAHKIGFSDGLFSTDPRWTPR